ncbi:Fe-S cluster assembly protein SufD, partial [Staphylococcus aureus]|nr:Fe-S cluster assembly protein SufD [Staphylococcus aureus]
FKQHDVKGDVYQSLSQLPESVREIIDVDHSKNLVIQHNNTIAYTQVDDNASKDGVIVEGLADALMNHSDLVQKHFMKDAVTVDEHRITALHTALVNGGVFVYVPKNVVVEHPVQYVVLHDDKNASFYNHVIIVT